MSRRCCDFPRTVDCSGVGPIIRCVISCAGHDTRRAPQRLKVPLTRFVFAQPPKDCCIDHGLFNGFDELVENIVDFLTLTLSPTAWEFSENVLGCNEKLVWTINHYVKVGPSRVHYLQPPLNRLWCGRFLFVWVGAGEGRHGKSTDGKGSEEQRTQQGVR